MTYRWTLVSAVAGAILWLVLFLTRFDLFEHIVQWIKQLERWEADEIIVILFLVLFGFFLDRQKHLNQRNRQIAINRERIRIHQATMRNVLDIVGNFLHHLQRFILEAEKSKGLKPESIESINRMLFETSDKLQEIADLDRLKETDSQDNLILLDTESGNNKGDFL